MYLCACACVCVFVKKASESYAAGNTDVLTADELSKLMHRQDGHFQQLRADNEQLTVSVYESLSDWLNVMIANDNNKQRCATVAKMCTKSRSKKVASHRNYIIFGVFGCFPMSHASGAEFAVP